METMTSEQQLAAQAAQQLATLLAGSPLNPSQLPRLHILLSRATDTARCAIEAIEALEGPPEP